MKYKYSLKTTTKFKKDYKLAKKRGLNMKGLMNATYNRIGCFFMEKMTIILF